MPTIGSAIQHHKIEVVLDHGKISEENHGRDTNLGHDVAVKFIRSACR